MRVVSAFFADAVSVHDGKLFVLGGVWDWYRVQALPQQVPLPMAVIAQMDADDRGSSHTLRAVMIGPDGQELWVTTVEVNITEHYRGDHVVFALSLHPSLAVAGRHVTLVEVDGDTDTAFALPLAVDLPAGT